jgi:uncharacterized protein YidB (DUF937 family)
MDLLKIGTQLLMQQLGDSSEKIDEESVSAALSDVMPGEPGEINLASIVDSVKSEGLQNMVESWLGDGENDGFSINQVTSLLGESKISEFASKLNIDSDTATNALSSIIPNLISQNSSNGSLVASFVSSSLKSGLAQNLVKGLFKKFF